MVLLFCTVLGSAGAFAAVPVLTTNNSSVAPGEPVNFTLTLATGSWSTVLAGHYSEENWNADWSAVMPDNTTGEWDTKEALSAPATAIEPCHM
jgi:hypothetical protein